jgi:hypothetical protein
MWKKTGHTIITIYKNKFQLDTRGDSKKQNNKNLTKRK